MGGAVRSAGLVSVLVIVGYVAAPIDPITVTSGGTVGISKDQPNPGYSLDVGGDTQVSGNINVLAGS
jgi:hypothetical protein